MSRTCTTSAAHRGRALFPADLHPSLRCLRLLRPRRPCWNRCSYRWRRRPEPPAGACPAAAAPAGCPAPAPSGFPFPSGSGCSCSPVSSLSAAARTGSIACFPASPFPAWPGACPCLQDGDLCGAACRMGFSGSADRMPMSGRQILSSSAQISTPQPPAAAMGTFQKNFFHVCSPSGKRASP